MNRRNSLNRALLMAVLINLILLTGSAWAFGASDKIASRVITDTANGGTTEALVVLAEQADLSPAAAFPSKLEKGRFVVDTLRAVAARSQAPLRAFLDQRENRIAARGYARGRVLDTFTYQGAFALHLAREAKAIPSSRLCAHRNTTGKAAKKFRDARPTPTGGDPVAPLSTLGQSVMHVEVPRFAQVSVQ